MNLKKLFFLALFANSLVTTQLSSAAERNPAPVADDYTSFCYDHSELPPATTSRRRSLSRDRATTEGPGAQDRDRDRRREDRTPQPQRQDSFNPALLAAIDFSNLPSQHNQRASLETLFQSMFEAEHIRLATARHQATELATALARCSLTVDTTEDVAE